MTAHLATPASTPDSALPLTPARTLAAVALLVGALWLGWKAWDVNITMSCWKDEWPHLPVCDDIMGRTPAEQVQRLQERLALNPGDSQALVALAAWARQPEAPPGLDGQALLAAAVRAAPQDARVLRIQANDAVSAQQWPQALDPLIRLSRYHADANATRLLAVLIAQAGNSEPLMAALMTAAKTDGAWLDRPLRAMPQEKLAVGSAMPLVLALMAQRGEQRGLTPALGQFLIAQLKREDRWMEAHALWRHLWNRPLPLVFNGGFEQAFVRGGFDWEVADANDHRSGARVATVGRKERGQVLEVSFTGKAMKPPVLRQDLLLLPGRYVLSGRMQSTDLRSEQGLAWVLSCAKDGRELARSPALKTTGREWTTWQVSATMPFDCAGFGARLTLQTFAPYEAKTGLRGEALFDDLQLVQQPNEAPGT
ncbi:hypothetical protein [Hydrogenophaga sp. PAMC20947]|uniref:hypothetical protein n=1 Tax=Hydrogenophaga sp. PAMC20947 TaxID=2565558 RepID=UPI00109DAE27|nr:hypothetical protein [Hydrogenophaga sp. PAMC20947]QCB47776.1 hypothetical protein E5678_18115 [Hydrogenophaga sp. PAMC20947]